jgi:hypothetical protein
MTLSINDTQHKILCHYNDAECAQAPKINQNVYLDKLKESEKRTAWMH